MTIKDKPPFANDGQLPTGFSFAGVCCGIKASGKPDMSLIVCDSPVVAAGVYTQNQIVAAPVVLCRSRTPSDSIRAVVSNSGNANACTGQQGTDNAKEMSERVATQIGCRPEQVLVMSTGVIGQNLPMDAIRSGIDAAGADLVGGMELDTKRRVGFMSTGMRQKLALSVVLGLRTPLLILDEPTANLDPTVRGAVLQQVMEARDDGRTVIFSSHVLSEIEETCDRVVFLRNGLLAHELTMGELFQRHRITATSNGSEIAIPAELKDQVEVREVKHGDTTILQIDTAGDLGPMLAWLDSLNLDKVRAEPLGLRTVYDSVHDGTIQDLAGGKP